MMSARWQPAVTAFLLLAAQSMHEWFLVTAAEIHPFFPPCCYAEMLGVVLRKNLLWETWVCLHERSSTISN